MSEARVVPIEPASTRGTFLTALLPLLDAAGVRVSEAWAASIFGHAFTFSMARGGGEVWQLANIEWCFLFRELDLLPLRFRCFDAVLRGGRPAPSPEELTAMKERTWEKVVEGIDRGVPSIAWGAMTVEQKVSGVPGFEWCLLVGYDAGARTYRVRHLPREPSWDVRFDGFGYTDPVQWYHVMTPAEVKPFDRAEVKRRAIAQAIEYAEGRRFDPTSGCNPVDAIGFAAYDLWKQTLDSNPRSSLAHASFLKWSRAQAADFLREANESGAARHYDSEVQSLRRLEDLFRAAAERGESSVGKDARPLLDEALASEREAIERLKAIAG
jgi:hypothetical protein